MFHYRNATFHPLYPSSLDLSDTENHPFRTFQLSRRLWRGYQRENIRRHPVEV